MLLVCSCSNNTRFLSMNSYRGLWLNGCWTTISLLSRLLGSRSPSSLSSSSQSLRASMPRHRHTVEKAFPAKTCKGFGRVQHLTSDWSSHPPMLNTAMNLDLVLYLSLSIYSFGSGPIFVIFNVISMYTRGKGLLCCIASKSSCPEVIERRPVLQGRWRCGPRLHMSSPISPTRSNTFQHLSHLSTHENPPNEDIFWEPGDTKKGMQRMKDAHWLTSYWISKLFGGSQWVQL